MKTTWAVSFAVLISCIHAQVADEWITQITDDQFGDPVEFFCNTSVESNQPPNGSYPIRWMFNDLTNQENGYNGTRWQISMDGYTMTILNVSKEDFGIYHCMMMTEAMEWYLVKLGLNVRGPYYEDMWEKYRMNTIIGCSSLLGFLVISVSIIVLYQQRFIADEEEIGFASGKGYGGDITYENAGYNGKFYEPPADYDSTVL